jgi:hypothetical protein
MTSETQTAEQQTLALAQSLLNVFTGVDQEIGERATRTAFMAKGWVPRDFLAMHEPRTSSNSTPCETQSATTFFNRGEKLKPAENALLCAAFHYSQYGCQAFSADELREFATEAGLVLPSRVDMTLKAAVKGGKKLFQVAGKGSFKFTSHGELFVQERWKVKPGKSSKTSKGQ